MPQLPIIIERQPVGALELPRRGPSPAERGFRALGEFGANLAEAEERRRRVDNILEASRRDAEFGRQIIDVEIEASKAATSKEILPLWEESVERLKREQLDSIQDPDLRNHMTAVLDREMKNSFGRVRALENRRWLDEGRADFLSSYNESLKRLGKMPPGSSEYQLEKHKIDSRIEALDDNGFFSEQAKVKLKADQEHQIDLQRGFFLLETNPEKLKDSLTPENFPNLSGAERETLRNHAEASLSGLRAEAQRAEKEWIDAINKDFLQRNVAGQLAIGQILQSDLPADHQRFWVDRLEQQRKAKAKEKDPFETSDPRVKGPTISSILREPEKWDVEKITGLMGKGLSISDTLQAVGLHSQLVNKEKLPESFSPLRQTLESLERLRKNWAFLPEDAEDVKEQAKNDEEAQKVMDALIRRSQAGEDPQKALNELMKPFFDRRTEGFFSRMMSGIGSFFTPPLSENPQELLPKPLTPEQALFEYDLDNRARDILRRNGKMATPQTIEKVKKVLRSKRQ